MVNSLYSLPTLLRLLIQSYGSLGVALARGGPGLDFDAFGRGMGWELMLRGYRGGADYVLTPVSSVRYFEFAFAQSCLPEPVGQLLDLSSPRLFSLRVARQRPQARVTMLNPDYEDIMRTMMISRRLNLPNLQCLAAAADILQAMEGRFAAVWSISVIEHISGAYDDREVMGWLYRALRPGGRLIVTVPVDRQFWNEYRNQAYYGREGEHDTNGRPFFQRFYDRNAIYERLVAAVGREPERVVWYGEREPGQLQRYMERWVRYGLPATVTDAGIFATICRTYACWEDMPGCGVCGLMFTR